jgi:quercetin dioxygenase-like cupin family protein
MIFKSFASAKPYEAPNHRDVRAIRLQGFEPGGPENFWVGLSHILPGGGAGPDSSPLEKVYVALAGEINVRAEGREHVLKPMDSVCIGASVSREVVNNGNSVASMIVVMPYPKKS